MTPPKSRYDSLDAWRGLACLMVVIFHSIWYVASSELDNRVRSTGGTFSEWILVLFSRFWIGVPFFFVISGYCIAASADAARSRPRGCRRYFARRFRRIYPPLFAALILATIVSLAALLLIPPTSLPVPVSDPRTLSAWQWFGNITLTEEWRPALDGSPKNYIIGQTWTLCYEEQFYIVVGLLILIAKRWFFPGVCVVTALVMLNLLDLNALVGRRLGMNLNAAQIRIPGLFINGLWVTFAAGVAVYYRLTTATPSTGRLIELVLIGFAVASAVTDPNLFDSRQTLTKFIAFGCAFAVLLCRLHRFDARLSEARCLAPLRFCGRMCYSLYLTHPLVAAPVAWACFQAGLTSPTATLLVTVPLAVLLSVALGWGFYLLIERRFMNSLASHSPDTARNAYTGSEHRPSPGPSPRTPPCPAVGSPCSP